MATFERVGPGLYEVFPPTLAVEDVVFICIGTDRSTGDSLGPLVGTILKRVGLPAIGTLEEPVHAMNLHGELAQLPKEKTIIAIDSSLGRSSSVGAYQVKKGPMRPGAGVGKDLGEVGDYSITGIVNVGGCMEYFVLQNTRLSLVMRMADEIAGAIIQRFLPLAEVAATKY